MWILNICVFASTSEKWGTNFIFQKNNFENLKKLQSIVIFVFFIKVSCQGKKSLSKHLLPFTPTPTFLEKNISSPPLLPN